MIQRAALFGIVLVLVALLLYVRRDQSEDPTEPQAQPPNLILVSIDTLRPDHLGIYDYERQTSPFLDSLATLGTVFTNAFAQASWTLPSHMSLMTGTYPHTHQVEKDRQPLHESIPTLAEILHRAGYSNTGFVTWVYLAAQFGFARGFDQYEELLSPTVTTDLPGERTLPAAGAIDQVLEWADGSPPQPFMLFLHLFDPHMSYNPPLEWARRFNPDLDTTDPGAYANLKQYIRGLHADPVPVPYEVRDRALALYDGEIRYTDAHLRRLFRHLEDRSLLENTMIVFTSDHGEEFGEHGSMEGHQWTLYDEVLRVPLLLIFPDGRHSGRSIPTMVESIDIAPTVLSVLGLDSPESFEGGSLLPLLEDRGETQWDETTFAQIRRFNQKWSIRTPEQKLIYTRDTKVNRFGVPVRAGFELYDLRTDPGERKDIFKPELLLDGGIGERLQTFLRARGPERAAPATNLTREQRERLRSLGYIDK